MRIVATRMHWPARIITAALLVAFAAGPAVYFMIFYVARPNLSQKFVFGMLSVVVPVAVWVSYHYRVWWLMVIDDSLSGRRCTGVRISRSLKDIQCVEVKSLDRYYSSREGCHIFFRNGMPVTLVADEMIDFHPFLQELERLGVRIEWRENV